MAGEDPRPEAGEVGQGILHGQAQAHQADGGGDTGLAWHVVLEPKQVRGPTRVRGRGCPGG